MSYNVQTSDYFERQAKPLVKKYKSLKNEIGTLIAELADDPTKGIAIGRGCYKIRLAIQSKGKGKRGGARVITCVVSVEERVVLLSIYDKADQDTISDAELSQLLEEVELK